MARLGTAATVLLIVLFTLGGAGLGDIGAEGTELLVKP